MKTFFLGLAVEGDLHMKEIRTSLLNEFGTENLVERNDYGYT